MKRFVSLILSVCFLFSINTVSYAANISSRKASNPVIQSMNDKYHVDFSGMSMHSSIISSCDKPGYIAANLAFRAFRCSLFSLVDIRTPHSMQMQGSFWPSAIRVTLWRIRYF